MNQKIDRSHLLDYQGRELPFPIKKAPAFLKGVPYGL